MTTSAKVAVPTTTETATALAPAVLLDIDGTLADVSHVVDVVGHPFDPTPENLRTFHDMARSAPTHTWVVDLAQAYRQRGHGIIVATARSEQFRDYTLEWLDRHGIHFHEIHMRRAHDVRPDHAVKNDMLNDIAKRWDIIHAIDDNPDVVRLLRSRGIPTTVVPGWPG